MTPKQLLLDCLRKPALLSVAREFELNVTSSTDVEELRDTIQRARSIQPEDIVEILPGRILSVVAGELSYHLERQIPRSGPVDDLRERILEELEIGFIDDEEDEEEDNEENDDDGNGDDDDNADWDEGDASDHHDYRSDAYRDRFFEALKYKSDQHAPRPYQRDAIRAASSQLSHDKPSLVQIATGGGKTLVGNDALVQWMARTEGWVLWVTKDWRLLRQAAQDLGRRHRGFSERLRRLGGNGTHLHPLPESPAMQHVVYTTLQTLSQRLGSGERFARLPSLVVWDECHWGEHGTTGKQLLRWCRGRIPILGLTATPRPPAHSKFRAVYHKDFATLVREGYLARPVVEDPVRTGVDWSPRRHGTFADFANDSLSELARNRKRNRIIVEHYRAAHHGKTIVFACNIEHAELLAQLFEERGIPARAVHSQLDDPREEEAAIDAFARGTVRVLVNVAKLTTGVDVPDAKTVFLCRPTLSDILFSQMVGRASRLHEPSGKTTFHIVEFTDNLEKFGDQLQQPQRFFEGFSGSGTRTESVRERSVSSGPMLFRPAYDPTGKPRWLDDIPDHPEPMRGLWYRAGQTFGVEFELTRDDHDDLSDREWREVAEVLRRRLNDALPGYVARSVFTTYQGMSGEKNHGVWNVERDRSCGWEVTSRILQNEGGYQELNVACDVLSRAADEVDLKLNYRTGTHVHLGWLGRSIDEVKRALQVVRFFEPALGTLVGPSRLVEFDGDYNVRKPNRYCQPVSRVFTAQKLARIQSFDELWRLTRSDESRYVSFNVKPLAEIHTVEVRFHNGTLEARKLLLWLSLCQLLLWIASQKTLVPDVLDRDVIHPDGDILQLVRAYGPPVPERFLARLHQRRVEVAELWRSNPALRAWAAWADRWSGAA